MTCVTLNVALVNELENILEKANHHCLQLTFSLHISISKYLNFAFRSKIE